VSLRLAFGLGVGLKVGHLPSSHFMTITHNLHDIEKHSTDPNECICRLTFLLEGAFLFAVR